MNKFHFDEKEKNFNAKLFTNCNIIFNTGFPPSPGVKQDCYSRHRFFMTQSEIDWKNQNKTNQQLSLFSVGVFLLGRVPNLILNTVKDEWTNEQAVQAKKKFL